MPRIVHFEIPYDDGSRSAAFYESVFGWDVQGWGDQPTYQLATTGPDDQLGINGALYQRQSPDFGVLIYVAVDDVDAALAQAVAAGGGVEQGRMAVPSVGWSAIVRDPEGSLIGLFQDDPTAAA